MNVVAIVNPIAGASRKGVEFQSLLARARQAGIAIERRVTQAGGQARQMAADLASQAQTGRSADAVIVVGGDGTIHEAADGLAGSDLPMAIWPTGTENLVAKYFGFRTDPDLMMACLRAARTRRMDLGEAAGSTFSKRSFLVVAGMGFDAEVVHRLTRMRKGHITHLTYSAPLWRTFWEHRFPCFRVSSEGRSLWEGRGLAFVGNLSRYSLGLQVIRDAICDDGLLDLCIFPCRGRLRLLGHSLRTLARIHVEHGGVRYARLRHIRVEAEGPVPVEMDGEAAGWLPLEMTVRPGALRLLVPPGRS